MNELNDLIPKSFSGMEKKFPVGITVTVFLLHDSNYEGVKTEETKFFPLTKEGVSDVELLVQLLPGIKERVWGRERLTTEDAAKFLADKHKIEYSIALGCIAQFCRCSCFCDDFWAVPVSATIVFCDATGQQKYFESVF